MNKRRKSVFFLTGVTLIELCVVMGILLLGCMAAIPTWQFLQDKVKANLEVNNLLQHLAFARETAILSHQAVALCGGTLATGCTGKWSAGFFIYISSEDVKTARVLRVAEGVKRGSLHWSRGSGSIVFTPQGFVQGQNGTFLYCPQSGDPRDQRAIALSMTGRARMVDRDEFEGEGCI